MYVCVCVCHSTPGRGLQRFRLSATVSGHHSAWQCGRTRGSLVDTEGAREGAEWRRVKEKRGERGSDCVSRPVRLNIRLESITHTAVHFPLSHAITSPQRPHRSPPLSSVIFSPLSLSLHPSYPLSPCISDWPSLSLPTSLKPCPHLSTVCCRFSFPQLQIYPSYFLLRLHLSISAHCSHFHPLCNTQLLCSLH